jgi:thymidylate synthase
MEFVEGVKDHWVRDPDDPNYSGEWTYTYSQRFTKYDCGERVPGFRRVNQVEHAVESLAKSPHSRRVKLVTWQPWLDPYTDEPPCLGEFWLRCSKMPFDDAYMLNGNAVFRSRDAFDAAFMNLWGEVEFMIKTAGQLQLKLGKPVRIGRLCDLSHSYHIYGKAVQRFKDLFLRKIPEPWEKRTWTREFARPHFEEARAAVIEKIRKKDANAR